MKLFHSFSGACNIAADRWLTLAEVRNCERSINEKDFVYCVVGGFRMM